jgi:hypothetical protein
MAASVWSGPARVVSSGTVTTFRGEGVYLEVPLGDRAWAMGIRFATDAAWPGPRVDSAILGTGVRLDLVNFDTAEGKGSAEPVLVGEIGDELLYLHFRAWKYGASNDHTFHWTLFLVQKAEVGWTPVVREDPEG